jgi:hypothetical protein
LARQLEDIIILIHWALSSAPLIPSKTRKNIPNMSKHPNSLADVVIFQGQHRCGNDPGIAHLSLKFVEIW